MIKIHGIKPERKRADRPEAGTNLSKLPIPLEYDPDMTEQDRQYWESLGFNFDLPEPKPEYYGEQEKKPKLKGKDKFLRSIFL